MKASPYQINLGAQQAKAFADRAATLRRDLRHAESMARQHRQIHCLEARAILRLMDQLREDLALGLMLLGAPERNPEAPDAEER